MTSRPCCDEIGDGVADHGEVFLQRGAQDFGDVQHGGLADERDDRRAGLEEQARPACPSPPAVFARRVLPKAASLACLNLSFLASRKNSMSFSLEPGQPPSM